MLYLNSILIKGDVPPRLHIWYTGIFMIVIVALSLVLLLAIYESLKLIESSEIKRDSVRLKADAIFIIVASIALFIIVIATRNKIYDLEPYKNVSLTEVSDLIIVNNDKVEIKPLTDKQSNYDYTYEVDDDNVIQIEKDQTQTFKIEEDTFYNRMYLIDKNNHKSELSEDEKNMIKSKRIQ